jgi:hypothetical protein
MKKIIFCLALLFSVQTSLVMGDTNHVTYLAEVVIRPEDYSETVLNTLCKLGVSDEISIIILAQAIHESANFTSYVFENTWNPFGMKLASVRETTRAGRFKDYSKYNSLEDAVTDYYLYMKSRNISLTGELSVYQYVRLLKSKGYFEDGFNNYYRAVSAYHKSLIV